jgi:NadR type nicotinamide-nucleotide adenylyltransferase
LESIIPIKKIVVIGPESTGKSTLCEQLAHHYNTAWCPEFAREYLLKNGTNYTYDDLLVIARGQVALEEETLLRYKEEPHSPLTTHRSPFFIDTDMYVMKVWCEFVFGKCHPFILDQAVKREYDLYLLCNVDLPWVKDELREYPNPAVRKKLYSIYTDCMINQPLPWIVITGDYAERLKMAITAVDSLLKD